MASPSISRWTSIRLPIATTFPQAPLRSRTVGLPQSGSDPGFPSWAFPAARRSSSTDIRTPRQRWFTRELVPSFPAAFSSAQCPRAALGPPSAQSPFAAGRRYRHAEDVTRPLAEHYFHFIAPTGSCAKPLPSCRLWHRLLRPVFAGCCQPLLRSGPSRRYLCRSFACVSGPIPRLLPGCTRPLLPPGHWPSSQGDGVGA